MTQIGLNYLSTAVRIDESSVDTTISRGLILLENTSLLFIYTGG